MQMQYYFEKTFKKTDSSSNKYNEKSIGNKLISLAMNPLKPDRICDFFKSTLWDEWCDSMLSSYEKMEKFTTFCAPFKCSSFPPVTKNTYPKLAINMNSIKNICI